MNKIIYGIASVVVLSSLTQEVRGMRLVRTICNAVHLREVGNARLVRLIRTSCSVVRPRENVTEFHIFLDESETLKQVIIEEDDPVTGVLIKRTTRIMAKRDYDADWRDVTAIYNRASQKDTER